MIGEIYIGKNKYQIDFSKGKDISIPLLFNGEQPLHMELTKPYLTHTEMKIL